MNEIRNILLIKVEERNFVARGTLIAFILFMQCILSYFHSPLPLHVLLI
jgi:hypothetical protein